MQRYNKKYTEHYARLTLMEYYNADYEILDVAESPDLQSKKLNVGIEVTQAISFAEGRRNHYDAQDSEIMGGNDESKYRYENALIRERIYDKLVKLNKNYTHYAENALYIFTQSTVFSQKDIQWIFAYVRDTAGEFTIMYDRYFINCLTKLFVLNIRSEETVLFKIPISGLRPLRDRAMMLSDESDDNETGEETEE